MYKIKTVVILQFDIFVYYSACLNRGIYNLMDDKYRLRQAMNIAIWDVYHADIGGRSDISQRHISSV